MASAEARSFQQTLHLNQWCLVSTKLPKHLASFEADGGRVSPPFVSFGSHILQHNDRAPTAYQVRLPAAVMERARCLRAPSVPA